MKTIHSKIALLSIPSLIITFLVWLFVTGSNSHYYVTGNSQGIELFGIRADGRDAVVDPQGKLAGTIPDYDAYLNEWNKNQMRRDFIFQIPGKMSQAEWLGAKIGIVGSSRPASDVIVRETTGPDGRRLAILSIRLPTSYPYRFPIPFVRVVKVRSVEHVDVTLRYYLGERGPPEGRFSPPTRFGQTIVAENDPNLTLQIRKKEEMNRIEMLLEINGARRLEFASPLYVEDIHGNRTKAIYNGGSVGDGQSNLKYRVPWMEVGKIQSIIFNERAHQVTFHHIPVVWPDTSPLPYPPYIEELAARWDKSTQELIKHPRLPGVKKALESLPFLRGESLIQQLSHGLRQKADFEQLSAEDRRNLRETAAAWLHASNPRVRSAALEIGLRAEWLEFVDPALEAIASDETERSSVAHALRSCANRLTEAQLDQIVGQLIQRDDPLVFSSMLRCLANRRDEASAVRLLRLARSEKPWLWWEAIQHLYNSTPGRELLQSARTRDKSIRCKVIAIWDPPSLSNASPEEIAATEELLAGALTPRLLSMQVAAFTEVFRAITERFGEKRAASIVVDFLRQLHEEWNEHQYAGRMSYNHWGANRAVKYLNHVYDVKLGRLGTNYMEEPASRHRFDWKEITRQASVWSEKGIDPSMLPVQWKPDETDLRLIWLNTDNREWSVIAIPKTMDDDDSLQMVSLEMADDFLSFSSKSLGKGRVEVKARMGVINNRSTTQTESFQRGQLPVNLFLNEGGEPFFKVDENGERQPVGRWMGDWQVWIEQANVAESVLAGTKLFESWMQKHLAGPLKAPASRVFSQH